MAGWFDDNAPGGTATAFSQRTMRAAADAGAAGATLPPAAYAVDSQGRRIGTGQGGAAPPSTAGGGTTDAGGVTDQASALQAALKQGLTGQAAVDWVQQNYPQYNKYGSGIEWQPSTGTYGVPGGYFAQDPNTKSWGMVNTTQGGGGGGGGGMMGGATGTGGFSPVDPYQAATFTGPTGLNFTNDPGYLARMQMGTDAIQGAAAAKGSILGGGTLKALERYGQDYGTNEFGGVFSRALQTAGFNNQVGQQNYLNRYGQYTDYQNLLGGIQDRSLRASQGLYSAPPG